MASPMALTMSAWFNPDNAAVYDRQRLDMCVGMIWRFLQRNAACRTLITLLLMIASVSFPFWQRCPFPDKMMWVLPSLSFWIRSVAKMMKIILINRKKTCDRPCERNYLQVSLVACALRSKENRKRR
jgi:hypothetical protein